MSDDIQYKYCVMLNNPAFTLPASQLQDMLIDELNELFLRNGSSIGNFNLPQPCLHDHENKVNRLIQDERSYDLADLIETSTALSSKLNKDQRKAYDKIIDYVMNEKPGFFFLSGHGGTGKTFVWKSILSYVRSKGKIVLAVASSGVASLLLQGGRTAHSRFKIPIDIDKNTLCDMKRGTNLADLMKECSLIISDEAPMTHRHCFETLDRTLRDILKQGNPIASTTPFGGIPVVLGGDFRQILPVIEGGSRSEIVSATTTNSPLWKFVCILKLHENMRLSNPNLLPCEQKELKEFGDWVLAVGNGRIRENKKVIMQVKIKLRFLKISLSILEMTSCWPLYNLFMLILVLDSKIGNIWKNVLLFVQIMIQLTT
jgi:hypothetical protein